MCTRYALCNACTGVNGFENAEADDLWIDKKGAVDLFNNWSVAGRTRHIGARLNFMRELKEQGVLEVKWIASEDNNSDMFTKNLSAPPFEKHMQAYVTDEKID